MTDRPQSARGRDVVPIGSAASHGKGRAVGLTEEERRILLTELAEIAAELDDLQVRTMEITARVNGAGPTAEVRRTGAA